MKESAWYGGRWHRVLTCLTCGGTSLWTKEGEADGAHCPWCNAARDELVDYPQACEHGQLLYSRKWQRVMCGTCGATFDEVEW